MNNKDGHQVGKQGAPEQRNNQIIAQINSTNVNNQRLAILKQLRENGPTSTFGFREIGITSAAPRIFELRNKGYKIVTKNVSEADFAGVEHHNIALYSLVSEADAE
jgi:hypothetical protein